MSKIIYLNYVFNKFRNGNFMLVYYKLTYNEVYDMLSC